MEATERIAREERRALRASFQAAGGSKRRPLQSFNTDDEKRAARLEHRDRLAEAVEHARDLDGFGDWLEALELNPHLSPMNCALAAYQAPGEIVDTFAGWKRGGYLVPKGERCSVRLTGPGFWPKAAFTAPQVGATDLVAAAPEWVEPDDVGRMLEGFRELLSTSKPKDAMNAFAVERCGRTVAYSSPMRSDR